MKTGRMAAAFAVLLFAGRANAGYPFVSDIPNQQIPVGGTTGALKFAISDDKTNTCDIRLTYRSSDRELVPEDDDHITIAGRCASRSVTVTPVPGRTGMVNITIYATDTDGDTNQDTFNVEVVGPPR